MKIVFFITLIIFIYLFTALFQYGLDTYMFGWSSMYNAFDKYALCGIPAAIASVVLLSFISSFVSTHLSVTLFVMITVFVGILDFGLVSLIIYLYLKDKKRIYVKLEKQTETEMRKMRTDAVLNTPMDKLVDIMCKDKQRHM